MRKTLFGMAGAAALAFSLDAAAGDASRSQDAEHQQERNRAASMIARQASGSATTDNRFGTREAVKPGDASPGEGSGTGEPSTKPKRSASEEEFLRNVWSMP